MIPQSPDAPDVLHALSKGDVRKANELAGSPYCIRALVVHGNHLGRSLGFPTANLEMPENKPFLLANGVYAVQVEVDQKVFRGMANAGIRPTVSGNKHTVEVNIFDFSGDLYGKTVVVCFMDRIRDERKFASLEFLVQQIQLDKKVALKLLD